MSRPVLIGIDGGGSGTRAVVGHGPAEVLGAGLFVVGDQEAGRKMQVYTAWDEAVDAADEVNARIRAELRSRRLGAAPSSG